MATATQAVPSGPAHVAVVSFLAARAAPAGGFWIALAGGVAIARVAERRGARLGFGASIAAMLETVAIIGPARLGIPLTQAATAPMLGRLEARGWRPLPQVLACAAIRLLHNTATTAFFIWVITGGLDAYAGTYDAIGRRLGVEIGSADALALTLAGLLAWAAFASTVQVLIYRRGLASWERLAADEPKVMHVIHAKDSVRPHERRFDPRVIALAAAVAFGLLLASTAWALLAAVALWLTVAWGAARPDKQPLKAGLLFAALLSGGAFAFALGGGLGLDVAARRAARAALLVLTATWLRGAAGADGLREVSRRVLGRLRRLPALPEASLVLDQIASEGRLAAAARTLEQQLRGVPKRAMPFVDAVLDWVVREASRPHTPVPRPAIELRARPTDLVLLIAAVLPALAL
jgi:nitroreductase